MAYLPLRKIINDLYIPSFAFYPFKANAPLIGEAYRHGVEGRRVASLLGRISAQRSNFPNRCSGFAAKLHSTGYSSSDIAHHLCQPRLGHISPLPFTG
jgi:hypothetical protein